MGTRLKLVISNVPAEFFFGSHDVFLFQTKKNQDQRCCSRVQTGTDRQPQRDRYNKNGRGKDAKTRPEKLTILESIPPTFLLSHQASKARNFRFRIHSIQYRKSWSLWKKANSGICFYIRNGMFP